MKISEVHSIECPPEKPTPKVNRQLFHKHSVNRSINTESCISSWLTTLNILHCILFCCPKIAQRTFKETLRILSRDRRINGVGWRRTTIPSTGPNKGCHSTGDDQLCLFMSIVNCRISTTLISVQQISDSRNIFKVFKVAFSAALLSLCV